jgi:hypothetical protein
LTTQETLSGVAACLAGTNAVMDAVDDKDLLPKKGLDEHGQLNQRHQIHCMHSGELPTPMTDRLKDNLSSSSTKRC